MRILVFLFIFMVSSAFSYFPIKKVSLKKVKGKYTYIPSGHTIINKQVKSVNGFYMMTTEVTNLDYMEFLMHLKQSKEDDLYQLYKPNDFNENFMKTYLNHPSYSEYPIVGISIDAANAYCKWLANKLTESKTLGKDVKNVHVRLPFEAEWMVAAQGGRSESIYPWGGNYVRNSNGKLLANFHAIDDSNVKYNNKTNQYEFQAPIKSPLFNYVTTKSYIPNDYGLFHMSGNVAEMVQENGISKGGSFLSGGHDIKIQTKRTYQSSSKDLGFRPVFTVTF